MLDMDIKMLAIIFTTAAGIVAMWATYKGNNRVANNAVVYALGTAGAYAVARYLGL